MRALDSMNELSDLTNGMKPGQSEVFEAREHSAQIRILHRMAFGSQDYSSEFFNHSTTAGGDSNVSVINGQEEKLICL